MKNQISIIDHMYEDYAVQRLKLGKHKITKPRLGVIQVFAQHTNAMTAYDIQAIHNNLDIVSIYRTIHLLEDSHLIHKIWSLGGYVACTILDTNCLTRCCHEFQVCTQCNCFQEIHGHHQHTHQGKGFVTTQHISEQLGLCIQCNSL